MASVPVLQPADPFLECAGEDLRRRVFMTENATGAALCLRPEFTIPICLDHMASGAQSGRTGYDGTVFRQGRSGASEFRQIGLEDLGDSDELAADAACLSDMITTLQACGLAAPSITLGDQQVFEQVVEALGLPQSIAARMERRFGAPQTLSSLIEDLRQPTVMEDEPSEIEALARAGDNESLVAAVEAMMVAASLPLAGGRTAQDITDRMIAKSAEARFRLTDRQAETLRDFLDLAVPLHRAVDALSKFAAEASLEIEPALTVFENRVTAFSDAGIELERIIFRSSFGRKLDYYSGLVFEVASDLAGEAVAGGGRYNRLCTLLGASREVPAVGFSVTMDRLPNGGAA